MRSKNAKPLIALALTGAGSALVVAFQVPDTSLIAATSAAASTNTTAVVSHVTATPRATAGATTTPEASPGAVTAQSDGTATTGPMATATPAPAATATPAPTATANSSSPYADGTYTGDAEQEPWGTFQVEVTISAGQMTDVSVVSAPSDGHSSRINSIAVPMLTQSVLSAQSTNVDMVSGATWTSDSYLTSVQSALDQAAAKNGN